MDARRRELVWVERNNFHGWACSECAWIFNPGGSPRGESLDQMIREFERQRAKEFASHDCAKNRAPRETK
jgi:hypothetical protein